jgi:long-subunit acyl-CoA synthetase (AMP-forming)
MSRAAGTSAGFFFIIFKNIDTLHPLLPGRNLRVKNLESEILKKAFFNSSQKTNTVVNLMQADAKQCAVALSKLGLKSGSLIGFFSSNNHIYAMGIIAGYYLNLPNVSLYDTLGREAVEYVVNDCELSTIFVQNASKLKLLFAGKSQFVKTVIMMTKSDQKLPTKENYDKKYTFDINYALIMH